MALNHPTPPDVRRRSALKSSRVVKTRPDPLQGRVILGRYRINSKLARGGMSTVYLGRDIKENCLCAIKILRHDLVLEPRICQRFLNESRAVQRIDHPAVVKIYDVGETRDGRLCLIMEYVDGFSLRKMMKSGPLSTASIVPIIGAVAYGLAAAHEQCVIHRDLKPENVLLPRKSSSNTAAKLVDFGIARIIDAPRITTTQHVMGTPQYIAPEQAMGKAVDHRADIYALGVMMFEMLTDELPFSGDDPEMLLRQHISTPPPPLVANSADSEIPEEFQTLVMRCLSKAPQNRPAHINDLLSVLGTIQT
ncbi:MAG: serine/threonine protein kinase [Proteobacteria bacterium]|nr:serine/threonine protein kinase [Pseudomonadota bacterium]